MKLSLTLTPLDADNTGRIENPDLRLLVEHAQAHRPAEDVTATVTALFRRDDAADPEQTRLELSFAGPDAGPALADLAVDLERISALFLPEGRYLGIYVTYPASAAPWKGGEVVHRKDRSVVRWDGHETVDWDGDTPVPTTMCLDTAGGIAVLARPASSPPRIVVAPTLLDSAALGDDVTEAMRRLHANLAFLSLTEHPVPPDAPHEALPARRAPTGFVGEEALAIVALRARFGQPPQGRIFPPLPKGHPMAVRLCSCSKPLGTDDCLQEVALGPDTTHPDAIRRYTQGKWYDAVGILAHRHCTAHTIQRLAKVLATLAIDGPGPEKHEEPEPHEEFTGRSLTEDEVRALPPGGLRDLLMAAFAVENIGAEVGWDEMPPTAYAVLAPDQTEPDESGEEPPKALIGLVAEMDGAAPDIFAQLATLFEQTPAKAKPLALPGHHLIGVAGLSEAWVNRDRGLDRSRLETRRLAELPTSVEVRFVILVGEGATVLLTRDRGDEPTASVLPPEAPLPGEFGEVRSCMLRLRRIVLDAYATADVD